MVWPAPHGTQELRGKLEKCETRKKRWNVLGKVIMRPALKALASHYICHSQPTTGHWPGAANIAVSTYLKRFIAVSTGLNRRYERPSPLAQLALLIDRHAAVLSSLSQVAQVGLRVYETEVRIIVPLGYNVTLFL